MITPLEQNAIATIILQQLGGRQFTLMTGSSKYVYGTEELPDDSDAEQRTFLRMNLTSNPSGANRLYIYYNSDDTYSMKFCRETLVNAEVSESRVQEFSGVYCEDLQDIFTQVTGLYTTLRPKQSE